MQGLERSDKVQAVHDGKLKDREDGGSHAEVERLHLLDREQNDAHALLQDLDNLVADDATTPPMDGAHDQRQPESRQGPQELEDEDDPAADDNGQKVSGDTADDHEPNARSKHKSNRADSIVTEQNRQNLQSQRGPQTTTPQPSHTHGSIGARPSQGFSNPKAGRQSLPQLPSSRIPDTGSQSDYAQYMQSVEERRTKIVQELQAEKSRAQQNPVGIANTQPRIGMLPAARIARLPGFPMDSQSQQTIGIQYQGHQPLPYGQMNPSMMQVPYIPYGYGFGGPSNVHLSLGHQMPDLHVRTTQSKPEQDDKGEREADEADEADESSDDDEPLKSRTKRHPSIHSQESDHKPGLPKYKAKPAVIAHEVDDSDSEIEFISIQPKKQADPTTGPPNLSSSPLSSPRAVSPANNAPPPAVAIDWKLPSYEVLHDPPTKKDDPLFARVSIPGLVREELLLSPDHAAQETHLLLHIFLPGQRALATPDPEPARAVLVFHHIATMVIEAFTQFEIGDEFGLGRGHWHDAHDQGDEEYVRKGDARDASPDEIFFAVVDRWRAGLEAGKKGFQLVRGVQEFCDVALDVIYYVKENGLLGEEVGKKKGTKGAAKKDGEEGDTREKRKGAQKVNELQPRKKVKTEKAEKGAKTKAKPKVKAKPAVTVVKRK